MIQYTENLRPEIDRLMNYPNVNAVYGYKKIINGIETDIDCLRVCVTKKVPISQLKHNEIIPSQILNDIQTDVIQSPVARSLSYQGDCLKDPQVFHRPLKGGVFFGLNNTICACTLGAIVKDATDNTLVGLTNNHCLGSIHDPAFGEITYVPKDISTAPLSQPPQYSENSETFGYIKRVVPFKRNNRPIYDDNGNLIPQWWNGRNVVDAGLCSIKPTTLSDIGVINIAENSVLGFAVDHTNLSGPQDNLINSYVNQTVKKMGATSCETFGKVVFTVASANVRMYAIDQPLIRFHEVIVIESLNDNTVAGPGDSGSVILTEDNKILGLLFGGSPDGKIALACRIDFLCLTLNIKPWQGDIVVPGNQNSTLTINNRQYNRYEDTKDPITHRS
jgi:hypothetical protein